MTERFTNYPIYPTLDQFMPTNLIINMTLTEDSEET